jgi:CelD/BcsL family acetyltransferase involved in cellulose biosynthesis
MSIDVVADGRPLTVAVLRSLDDLAALRDGWNAVYATTASGFLCWEWMYTWAERFVRDDRQLLVLAVYERSALVGIAPWYVGRADFGPVRVRQIAFLGTPEAGSDYLDVLAKRGKDRVVAAALVEVLFGTLRSSWDTLGLTDVPANSAFLTRFISRLRERRTHYATEEGAFCPAVQLPRHFEQYLGQLSGHARGAFRRKMRALRADSDVVHSVYRCRQEILNRLGEFHALYSKRWGQTQVTDDLFALLRSYVERSSDQWRPELSLLHAGDRPVAGLFHLVRDGVMYQYLMAIDRGFCPWLSIGCLACAMNIEAAIERDFAEYDFLKTDEDYKLQFTCKGRRSINLRVHNGTLRSFLAWTVMTGSAFRRLLLTR